MFWWIFLRICKGVNNAVTRINLRRMIGKFNICHRGEINYKVTIECEIITDFIPS